jgi:hypothetical protein
MEIIKSEVEKFKSEDDDENVPDEEILNVDSVEEIESESESEKEEEEPQKKTRKRDSDYLKNIRNSAKRVKAINAATGETKIYKSMYACSKQLGINVGLIQIFCNPVSPEKGTKKNKNPMEGQDGNKYTFEFDDSDKTEIIPMTAEEKRQKQLEYNRNYNRVNRQKILEYQTRRINCECGGKYQVVNKHKHMDSKKHLTFIHNPNHADRTSEDTEDEDTEDEDTQSSASTKSKKSNKSTKSVKSEDEVKVITTKEDDPDFKLDVEFQT